MCCRRRHRRPYLLSSHVSILVVQLFTVLTLLFLLYIITYVQYKYFLMITTHSLVLFTVCTLVFTVHTLLIITFSLQYLLLLMEVLFTVLFTDRVFTVHYHVNTVCQYFLLITT